jgi:hypothetical protein
MAFQQKGEARVVAFADTKHELGIPVESYDGLHILLNPRIRRRLRGNQRH